MARSPSEFGRSLVSVLRVLRTFSSFSTIGTGRASTRRVLISSRVAVACGPRAAFGRRRDRGVVQTRLWSRSPGSGMRWPARPAWHLGVERLDTFMRRLQLGNRRRSLRRSHPTPAGSHACASPPTAGAIRERRMRPTSAHRSGLFSCFGANCREIDRRLRIDVPGERACRLALGGPRR
jgi:hypothetical protein